MLQQLHTSVEFQTVAKEIEPYLESGEEYYYINTNTKDG